MPTPPPLAVAVVLCALLAPTLGAPDVVPWSIPSDRQPYASRSGTVGDVVRFDYGGGHNVVLHPSGSCDAVDGVLVGTTGPTDYAFAEAGAYTFACDISDGLHCGLGQIITFTIVDAAAKTEEVEAAEGDKEEGGGGEEGKEEEKEKEEKEEKGEEKEEEEEEGKEEEPLANEGQDLSVEADDSDEVLASYSKFFNPGEEMNLLEFRIKPYKIPSRTTTYVDFVFNIPEHVGKLVHVVVGDVIISQPRHLHHFVLTGCTEPVDPDTEGLPLPVANAGCAVPLGGGWASGGDFFGGIPLDAGAAFGVDLGIRALNLNVHYTDGDKPDPDQASVEGRALAVDGIRLLYTPRLRARTVLFKPVLDVGGNMQNTTAMRIPPAAPRYFYTKTCTVEPACLDTSAARLAEMGLDFTCGAVAGACDIADAEEGLFLQLLCPAACGACDASRDRGGAGYHVAAVNYHAHLLGREMYTTLRPNATRALPVDLASQDLWIYDFQVTYPLQDAALRVYPGDQIQATCVYDSTAREDDTIFSMSTYDEMCITQLSVLVDTPAAAAGAAASLQARLNALSFNCAVDDASAIWGGALGAAEDGRDIWKDHPASEANCTFPVGTVTGEGLSLSGDAIPTLEARCGQERTFVALCDGSDEGAVLNEPVVAGEYCDGGSMDGTDSNDYNGDGAGSEGNVSFQELCADGGGTSAPYTCQETEEYHLNDGAGDAVKAEEWEATRLFFQPKCCTAQEQDGTDHSAAPGEISGDGTGGEAQEAAPEAAPEAAREPDADGLGDAPGAGSGDGAAVGPGDAPGAGVASGPSQEQDGAGLGDAPGEISSDGNGEELTSGSGTGSPSFLFLLSVVACFVATL